MGQRQTAPDHEFPLRRGFHSIPYVGSLPWLTIRRLCTLVAVLVAAVELIRLSGALDTPIPFSYPLYLDIFLVYAVLYIIEALHKQLDEAKSEIIVIARVSEQRPDVPAERVPEEAAIRETFERRFDWALDPKRMGFSGVLTGVAVLLIMSALGVLDAYPYILMNFVFGAAHGVLLPVIFVGPSLIKIVPEKYINDLNGIDPAGVGGYPKVGEAIGKAAWYGTVIINIDFLILGSVAFLDNSGFQTVVVAIYVFELLILSGFTLGSTLRVRNVLKQIRDRRVRELQWRYGLSEGLLLTEQEDMGQDTDELLEIIAYSILFERLNDMNLWPINISWWTRFIGSIIATASVIFIQLILVIDVSQILVVFR